MAGLKFILTLCHLDVESHASRLPSYIFEKNHGKEDTGQKLTWILIKMLPFTGVFRVSPQG